MNTFYLGTLAEDEPLYHYLRDHVLGQVLGVKVEHPVFDMERLHPKMLMVRYHERLSGVDLACKFYGRKHPAEGPPADANYFSIKLRNEYDSLTRVRALGFELPPYRVVEPFAFNEALEYLLVEEYVDGPKLDTFIRGASAEGQADALLGHLGDLAGFLGRLHRRSQQRAPVQAEQTLGYLGKMIQQLDERGVIDQEERQELDQLCTRWAGRSALACAPLVLRHGDATPTNFVFRGEHEVIAIDLERSDFGDGMADVGSIEAELRHAFLSAAGAAEAGAAYTEHFRAAYREARQPEGSDAASMDERGSFWRGVYALRIARNDWLELAYRRQLIEEACLCLSSEGLERCSSISTIR